MWRCYVALWTGRSERAALHPFAAVAHADREDAVRQPEAHVLGQTRSRGQVIKGGLAGWREGGRVVSGVWRALDLRLALLLDLRLVDLDLRHLLDRQPRAARASARALR